MNDTLKTNREYRLDEARRVFGAMQQLLQRIIENDEITAVMDADLADEINGVLDRAAVIAF